jgi:hypothetical protein
MTAALVHSTPCPGGVAAAFTAVAGEGWAARKAEVLHDGSRVVRREERPDGGVLLAVSRELPSGVPGYLERFLPRDGRIVQTDEWEPERADGSRHGTWGVDLAGAPGRAGGTLLLAPAADGCTYTVEGEVAVSIPLVGGKAERFVRDMLVKLLAKEAEVLRGMLTA